MATRRKPPAKPDLSDLKARLGLTSNLAKQPNQGAAPGDSTVVQSAPQAAPGGQHPQMQRMPQAHAPQAQAPQQMRQMPQQRMQAAPQPQEPQRPSFAGPPGGPSRRPPGPPGGPRKAKPKPKPEEKWNPPASDPTAAADVPIKSHKSLAQLFGLVVVTGVISLFCGALGFWFGNGLQQRNLYNAQSQDATRVLELVKPKIEKLQALTAAVNKSTGEAPEEELLKALKNADVALDPSAIARGNLLLGPDRTAALIRFTSDSKLLSKNIQRHVAMTTQVDKKELDDLATQNEALNARGFAVTFNSDAFVRSYTSKKEGAFKPQTGHLVTFDSEPVLEEGDYRYQTRFPSNGRESKISARQLILVDKSNVIRSGGPNAQVRYQRRHAEIKLKLKEMSQYSDSLISQLEELASRPSAPLLSTSSN